MLILHEPSYWFNRNQLFSDWALYDVRCANKAYIYAPLAMYLCMLLSFVEIAIARCWRCNFL